MIGFLRGRLVSKSAETQHCLLNVHDVGYEVILSRRSIDRVLVGSTMDLWIHTHVREDILVLYGFEHESEKNFFRLLLSVSGLGPKTALSLLGEHGAERLLQLILTKQPSAIAEAPGVGKKLAERLIMELLSKVEKWSPPTSQVEGVPQGGALKRDLLSALVHLGYQPNHAKGTLDKMTFSDPLDFEGCLKTALKEMSSHF